MIFAADTAQGIFHLAVNAAQLSVEKQTHRQKGVYRIITSIAEARAYKQQHNQRVDNDDQTLIYDSVDESETHHGAAFTKGTAGN